MTEAGTQRTTRQILSAIKESLHTVEKPDRCPFCNNTGWEDLWQQHDEVYGPNSTPVCFAVPCRKCKGRIADAPRYNIRLPFDAFINAFDLSRYKDANGNLIDFSGQMEIVKGYIKNFMRVQKESAIKGLYFYSAKAGTGKTYLASIVCNELYNRYRTVPKYTTETELLNEIGKSVSYADMKPRDTFKMAQVLFLDDLWRKESGRDWLTDELYSIIDYRYQKGLPVIATSNISLSDTRIDGRIADRLNEMCAVICMPEVEIRKQNKSESKTSFWDIIKEE